MRLSRSSTIDASESPISEDDLPNGYKTKGAADDSVFPYNPKTGTGYNYELARKIAHYLQGKMGEESATKFVTLLGDGSVIPPSYYFAARSGFGQHFGVTDRCYAANTNCMNPKLAVGRLPFSALSDMENYLAKVRRWLSYAGTAPSELSLYGGKAIHSDVYVGELGTLRTINSETAD